MHVSLGVEDPAQLEPVEHRGTATVAAAAAQHGLERISYLTGSLVRVDYGPKIAEHRAKLAAEQAIQDSGVPYTFFRPTYFTNTLPRHVQGRVVVMLGRQRQVLHPVCAEDFAAQVARAFATPAAANRDFYIHGPQPLTLRQALGIYRQIVVPDRRLITVPLPVMSAIDRLFMGGNSRRACRSWACWPASASTATQHRPTSCSAHPPPRSRTGAVRNSRSPA